MYHDGESLKRAIKVAGLSVKVFAEKMYVHRNTVNRWFDNVIIQHDTRIEAAKVLHLPIGELFPRLADKKQDETPVVQQVITTPNALAKATPEPDALQSCQAQVVFWQSAAYENLKKSYENLEQYNQLLKEHNQLLAARSKEPSVPRPGVVASTH